MGKRTLLMAGVAAAAGALLVAPAVSAVPASDARGYVDSTARCAAPSEVVVFGSTGSSRVAICKSADGEYQYRGVRLRDGARLIVPASPTGDEFIAENDGITYFVSAKSLVVSADSRTIREEPMIDFHESSSVGTTPAPSKSVTPTKPLPPPLPAEVGGS